MGDAARQAPLGEKGHIGHRSGVAFHQLFQANGGGPGPQAVGEFWDTRAQTYDSDSGKIYAETNDKTARRSLQYLKPTDRVLEFAKPTAEGRDPRQSVADRNMPPGLSSSRMRARAAGRSGR